MAERKLGQDAIDELFSGRAATAATLPEAGAEAYHFGRASQISGDQMRAIRTVNEQFARNLTHVLGAWLRVGTQVSVVAVEQLQFAEYLESAGELAYMTVLRLEPLGGFGLLELDVRLALRIVDLLLGGQGAALPERALTEIETAIVLNVVEMMTRELSAAWGPVGLRFAAERRDAATEAPRTMQGVERTLCLRLQLEMLGITGDLTVCLPAVLLNTVHRRLLSVRERPRRRGEEGRERLATLVREACVDVHAQLPQFAVSAAQLAQLSVGATLATPWVQGTSAEIVINGECVVQAQPVQRGEHAAVQLLPQANAIAAGAVEDLMETAA